MTKYCIKTLSTILLKIFHVFVFLCFFFLFSFHFCYCYYLHYCCSCCRYCCRFFFFFVKSTTTTVVANAGDLQLRYQKNADEFVNLHSDFHRVVENKGFIFSLQNRLFTRTLIIFFYFFCHHGNNML